MYYRAEFKKKANLAKEKGKNTGRVYKQKLFFLFIVVVVVSVYSFVIDVKNRSKNSVVKKLKEKRKQNSKHQRNKNDFQSE